jgi:hypothetical protein
VVPRFHAVAHLDLRSEIARHRYFPDVGDPILDDRHLQAVAIEDDGIRRDQQRLRLARNLEVDRAINTGGQRAVRVRVVDLDDTTLRQLYEQRRTTWSNAEKVGRSAMVTFQSQALSCKVEFRENVMRRRLILIITAILIACVGGTAWHLGRQRSIELGDDVLRRAPWHPKFPPQ